MKNRMITYGIIAFVIIVLIGIAIGRTTNAKEKVVESTSKENPYVDMRNMAFATSAEELGLQFPSESNKVYAIIADLPMSGAVVTIVSYITGDTSIYLSSGGGFVGAGQHESVQKVVKKFIDFGQPFAVKGEKFDTPALPTNGDANFYFLSNTGKTKITESLANLESGQSEYAELFKELNLVISAIRMQSGG